MFLCHNFSLPRFARFVPYLSFLHAKEDQRGEACLEPEKKSKLLFSFFFGFFMIKNYLCSVFTIMIISTVINYKQVEFYYLHITIMKFALAKGQPDIVIGTRIRRKLRLRLIEVYRFDWTNW